jgi:acyl-CoA synthetase (AMP-forming)/AMP-acid ligase II
VVRLAPGIAALDLADITDALDRAGLARQKWPEELLVVDDFPRTAAGKVRKVELRDRLRSASPATAEAP